MDNEIDNLRKEYKGRHPENNEPLPAWDADELRVKISEFKTVEPAKEATEVVNTDTGMTEDDGKEKTYKLTEDQLQQIMSGQRPQNIFERDLEPVEEEAAKPRTYTCKVALWQKDADSPLGVVTDLKTIRHDQDPITKLHNVDIIRATITFENEKTHNFEFPIGDLIKIFTLREEVIIVKEERKKMKMDRGMVHKVKTVKEGGINTRMAGEVTNVMIPLRERFLIPIITIKRRNGQVLVLPPRVVNI